MTTTVEKVHPVNLDKPLFIQIISPNNLLYGETHNSIEDFIEWNGLKGNIHSYYVHSKNGNYFTVIKVLQYVDTYGQETIKAINESNDGFVKMEFPEHHPYKHNGRKFRYHKVMIIDDPNRPLVLAEEPSAKPSAKNTIKTLSAPKTNVSFLTTLTKNISQTETESVTTDVSTITSVVTVVSHKEEAEKIEAELVETNKKAKTLEARLSLLKQMANLEEELKKLDL
jgi:hypothetical protein